MELKYSIIRHGRKYVEAIHFVVSVKVGFPYPRLVVPVEVFCNNSSFVLALTVVCIGKNL